MLMALGMLTCLLACINAVLALVYACTERFALSLLMLVNTLALGLFLFSPVFD